MARLPPAISDRDGLLIIGHGTRCAAGRAEFEAVVDEVAARCPGQYVAAGYLELARPTIAQAAAALAAAGARRIHALPLLLFSAGHAQRDIPAALRAAAASFPGLEVSQGPALECQEAILRLSAMRFTQALQGQRRMARADTLWLLVGRGSRDPRAQAAFRRFARLRRRRTPVGRQETAWLAMAQPRLGEALARAAGRSYRRVVVQPHLLFAGELATQVCREVASAARRWPEKEWLVTQHLGDSGLIAEAVLEVSGLSKGCGKG